ncbi:subtilase-type protease inhibitor [Streptomyces sp. MUM 178J]|uniref:subtilase-type protease inhibitor n=1 Tax=Streptomyces sp. MUM 178J TaxID=2791991 RepID=UPI001F03A07C|nr:subtilase-type protease inhibitor [Streptomyces sp. MUM 178J]WRQ78289.1 subtilase-type protease inhibitor [Streptomyces sp. MUM 178J]
MQRSVSLAAAALIAVTATAAGSAAGHAADDPPAGHRPGVWLTVSDPERTWLRGVLLTCHPEPGGPHPDPAGACEAVSGAKGDFARLPGDPHLCTKEYDPVIARAVGIWNGKPVAWQKIYPNPCELDAATGTVFRF